MLSRFFPYLFARVARPVFCARAQSIQSLLCGSRESVAWRDVCMCLYSPHKAECAKVQLIDTVIFDGADIAEDVEEGQAAVVVRA